MGQVRSTTWGPSQLIPGEQWLLMPTDQPLGLFIKLTGRRWTGEAEVFLFQDMCHLFPRFPSPVETLGVWHLGKKQGPADEGRKESAAAHHHSVSFLRAYWKGLTGWSLSMVSLQMNPLGWLPSPGLCTGTHHHLVSAQSLHYGTLTFSLISRNFSLVHTWNHFGVLAVNIQIRSNH